MIALLVSLLLTTSLQDDVTTLRDKASEIDAFIKTAKTPEALSAAVGEYQRVAAKALELDAYDLAVKTLGKASRVSRATRDKALISVVQEKLKEAKSLEREWKKVKRSLDKLEKDPADARANLAVGMFIYTLKGNWEKARPHLRKCSDGVLRGLAELDATGVNGAEEQVALAERWLDYAKKKPEFKERGLHWYKVAWPQLEGIAKEKARGRVFNLQAPAGARPKEPGLVRRISGWTFVPGGGISHLHARSGKTSARLARPADKPRAYMQMVRIPAQPGQKFVMSFYVLSVGTKGNPGDGGIYWLDKDQKGIPGAGKSVKFKPDFPFWEKYAITGTMPPDASFTASDTSTYYEDGAIWVDDISIKVNGKEVVQNGGFEER